MEPFAGLGYRRQVAALRRLAGEALGAYPVEVARVVPLAHRENTTFRVDAHDGQRYVLRIHRITGSPFHPVHPPDEVRSELEWLLALTAGEGDGEAGQPSVPGPVVNESGELVTVTETAAVPGPRPCVMLRWVPGRFVDDGLTPTHLRRVGRFMAGLHRQARSFTPPAGFVRPVVGDLSGDVAAYVIGEIGDVCGRSAAADVARVVDGVAAALDDLGQAPETFGLLHADLHQENYLFNRGRVGAIDFDDCGWGHYAADLAVTLSEIEGRVNTDALRQALFAGYTEVAELPPGTGRYLPAFLARRELQLTLWFIEQRDHPGFAGWADEVTDGLRWLRALAPALPS